jgi:DNA repair photolyase
MDLINARSIFSPATGFIRRGGFDWSCNPYVGCTFGCSYCYAMFLPQNRRPRADWGRWVTAKRNAVALAERRAPKLAGQAVYLSSVTDPYQPVERSLFLTRGILEALAPHQPRLLVQTRGPLVLRDLDVLQRFTRVRVNLSVPTDSERVWKAFEPKSPPLERRWQVAEELKAAGLPVGLCLTPLLPLEDVRGFVDRVAAFRPDVLVVQDFHDSGGGFGADTAPAARQLLDEWGWTPDHYRRVVEALRERLPAVFEGETGFFPP